MLQPGSGLSGGVTQCLLLKSGSQAVASGIGSAISVAHSHVSDGPYIEHHTISTQHAACQHHMSWSHSVESGTQF